jgi:hypothetical protein
VKYIATFLLLILTVSIILMPVWIIGVYRTAWPLLIKKGAILMMVITSCIISLSVIMKPSAFLSTKIIGIVINVLYVSLVIAAAYHYWPRK